WGMPNRNCVTNSSAWVTSLSMKAARPKSLSSTAPLRCGTLGPGRSKRDNDQIFEAGQTDEAGGDGAALPCHAGVFFGLPGVQLLPAGHRGRIPDPGPSGINHQPDGQPENAAGTQGQIRTGH